MSKEALLLSATNLLLNMKERETIMHTARIGTLLLTRDIILTVVVRDLMQQLNNGAQLTPETSAYLDAAHRRYNQKVMQ